MRAAPPPADGQEGREDTLSTPAPLSTRRFLAALALLVALLAGVLAPRLAAPPLERAEIYFVDAARAMVETGDWLVPRYQGEPFFDKPVLSYWAMAASMRLFGPTPAAARLVPLAASLLLVIATAALGAMLFDRRSGLATGIVLATTLAFLSFARVAMSDMLLAFWTTAAVALGLAMYRSTTPARYVVLVGAVLGLGFATKGPIAVLVPGIALLLLALQHRDRPLPAGPWPVVLSAAVFVCLGGGWFAALYLHLGAEPLAYFFLRENLERFAGEAYDVGRPFWFYPPALLAEGLPWSAFLPVALWRLLGRDAEVRERRAVRWLVAWLALVLVPLSFSRGKIDYYLLPLYPATSLVLGRYFCVRWGRTDRVWARLVSSLGALIALACLLHPPRLPEPWLPAPGQRVWAAAVLGGASLALLAAAVRPRAGRVLAALAAGSAAAFLVVAALVLPSFSAAQPNQRVAADVARELRYEPRARLAYCEDPARTRRDVLFVTRQAPVEQCDLWGLAASREPYLLLVTPSQEASLRAIPSYRHVASYRYLPARTLTLGGAFSRPEPGRLALVANFTTRDPVADRKKRREYRKAMIEEWKTLPTPAPPVRH